MIQKNEDIKKVKSVLNQQQKEFIKSVVEGNAEKARNASEWISLSGKIIAEHKKRNNIIFAGCIGFLCLALTAVISVSHVKTTNVSLELSSETLCMKLEESWKNFEAYNQEQVWINNVIHVSESLNPTHYSSDYPVAIEFLGNNIQVNNLQFNNTTELELHIQNNTLTFFTNDSVIDGKIGLRKGIVNVNDRVDTIDIPENRPKKFYAFTSKKMYSNEYTRLDFSPAEKVSMLNIKPATLHFLKENPAGSGIFKPTLTTGKVILHEIDQQIELLRGENLQIEFTNCRLANVLAEKNNINTIISGDVKTIKGGFAEAPKNYKPTLLEYYYHNQRVALLWSAFVFLMGIMYSIKNVFLK